MNKKVVHGSTRELENFNERKELEKMSPEQRRAIRGDITQKMEEYDPGGKKAHKLAAKYHKPKEVV